MQADPVVRVLGALEREGVRYAVFGAVALNAVRPKDRMDAEALRRKFALEDD